MAAIRSRILKQNFRFLSATYVRTHIDSPHVGELSHRPALEAHGCREQALGQLLNKSFQWLAEK